MYTYSYLVWTWPQAKSQLTVPDLGQNVAEDRTLVVSRHREGLTEALRL